MKISCGTDIIEIDRIKDAINNLGERFIHEIYTKSEIEYCESRKNAKFQHYAARFAAKEAVYKAISEHENNISWKNVEVINSKNGKPQIGFINVKIPQISSIDISLSHCKNYAIAMVTILYDE